jgi:kynurenine formamidase
MTQNLNKWVYLSYPLNCETPAYGGGDSLKIQHEKSIEKGDSCNTQHWSLSNHMGTHIDFPRHFVQAGKTSEDYGPEFWIFHSPFYSLYFSCRTWSYLRAGSRGDGCCA